MSEKRSGSSATFLPNGFHRLMRQLDLLPVIFRRLPVVLQIPLE